MLVMATVSDCVPDLYRLTLQSKPGGFHLADEHYQFGSVLNPLNCQIQLSNKFLHLLNFYNKW